MKRIRLVAFISKEDHQLAIVAGEIYASKFEQLRYDSDSGSALRLNEYVAARTLRNGQDLRQIHSMAVQASRSEGKWKPAGLFSKLLGADAAGAKSDEQPSYSERVRDESRDRGRPRRKVDRRGAAEQSRSNSRGDRSRSRSNSQPRSFDRPPTPGLELEPADSLQLRRNEPPVAGILKRPDGNRDRARSKERDRSKLRGPNDRGKRGDQPIQINQQNIDRLGRPDFAQGHRRREIERQWMREVNFPPRACMLGDTGGALYGIGCPNEDGPFGCKHEHIDLAPYVMTTAQRLKYWTSNGCTTCWPKE